MIQIEAFGMTPVAWSPPRVTRNGSYSAPALKAWQQFVALKARTHKPIPGPVVLKADFHFRPPPSWALWKRQEAYCGELAHTQKPDASNLLKAVEDALKGVVFDDDCYVVAASVSKAWHYTEGVTVTVAPALGLPSQIKTQKEIV